METNLPVAPKDVEALRTELKRSEGTGTLFVGIWQLARYALATLEWADTLTKQVADQIGTIVDLRSKLRDAQEVAQDLVMKAEQWQKQLEWHYEGHPSGGGLVNVILADRQDLKRWKIVQGAHQADDWYIFGEGWLNKMPAMRLLCWQEVIPPNELQAQDKES